MEALRIRLCGRTSVQAAAGQVELTRPKEQLLLAFLVLERSRTIRRDELIEVLWPVDPPESPGAALATVLSRVRRALAPARVDGRDRLTVSLPPGAWVDVEAAREAPPREALDFLRDQLLPGVDNPWARERREELAELRQAALEDVARAGLATGGPALADAERAARELIEQAPFRESAAAVLIDVLRARGDHADALREFDRVRVLLRDELGVPPGPELQRLHAQLLAGEQWVRDSPAEHAAKPGPELPDILIGVAAGPLVGRDEDLEALAGPAAAGGVALLVGEPGIGKTRLAAEVAVRRHESGAVVLYGRCEEQAIAPYGPFLEALRRYVVSAPESALAEQVGNYGADLARLVPELGARVPGLPKPVAVDPEAARFRLFEAIAAFLERLASNGALLIVEDLHWADDSTLALLRHLGRLRPRGVQLLATFRGTELAGNRALSAALAGLRRDGPVARVDLTGLDEERVEELIGRLSDDPAPHGLAGTVVKQTDGNPFFVREVLRHAAEIGAPPGSWPAPPALERAGIPTALRDVLGDRVDRLGDDAARLLTVGAVAGREFDYDVVAAAAGGEPDDALDHLEHALGRGLLTEVGGAPGRFSFAHALVRETLYERLAAARRLRIHAAIGGALEELRFDDLETHLPTLALHWRAAADAGRADAVERALRYSERAGDAAAAVFSDPEALEHYRAAQRLAAGRDQALWGRVTVKAGDVALRLGRIDDAIEGWHGALDDAGLAPAIRVRIGDALTAAGARGEALDQYRTGIGLVGDRSPDSTVVRLYAQSAWLYLSMGQDMLAIYAAEKAVRLADAVGEPQAAARAHGVFGRVHGRVGDAVRAREALDRSLALARQAGRTEEVRALRLLADHLDDSESDAPAAREARLHALAVAERTRDRPAQIDLLAALAAGDVRAADWASVRERADAAEELVQRIDLAGRQALPDALRALLRWRDGDAEAADAALAAAAGLATGANWIEVAVWAWLALGYVRLERGDAAGCVEATDAALAVSAQTGLVEQDLLARSQRVAALTAAGRRGDAEEFAASVAQRAERVRAPAVQAIALQVAGFADPDPGAAAATLRSAVAAWDALERPLEATRAAFALACRLSEAGSDDAGPALLDVQRRRERAGLPGNVADAA